MSGPGRQRRGVLTREDARLWAHVARQVTPLPGRKAPVEEAELPPPAPAPRKAERIISLPPWSPPAQAAPALPPLAPLERRMRQRLSRGQTPVDGAIDLHGLRQAEAHGALLAFIRRAQASGASLVVVVTGKGAPGSDPERGILRRLVPHWLADPALRRCIVGFEPAGRGHGGDGALYVRIRRARERS